MDKKRVEVDLIIPSWLRAPDMLPYIKRKLRDIPGIAWETAELTRWLPMLHGPLWGVLVQVDIDQRAMFHLKVRARLVRDVREPTPPYVHVVSDEDERCGPRADPDEVDDIPGGAIGPSDPFDILPQPYRTFMRVSSPVIVVAGNSYDFVVSKFWRYLG